MITIYLTLRILSTVLKFTFTKLSLISFLVWIHFSKSLDVTYCTMNNMAPDQRKKYPVILMYDIMTTKWIRVVHWSTCSHILFWYCHLIHIYCNVYPLRIILPTWNTLCVYHRTKYQENVFNVPNSTCW